MGKKIMVLNGSPRAGGNTQLLAAAFAEGAEQAGHSVETFHLRKMQIHPCIGCYKGGKDAASPCVQKDEMDSIYAAYRDADVVVLASPLYYWSFSAQLKMAIDRLFAATEANGFVTPKKECVMLIAAEGADAENFKPMVDYYHSLVQNLEWADKGMVLAGGVTRVGDITGSAFLEEARALGAGLV